MPYVVKAISDRGPVTWLRRSARGIRSLSIREHAEIFQTEEEARTAIAQMPAAFTRAGLAFCVEEAEAG
jgi:hypothetical protein